jgi:Fic family protein
MLDAGPEGFVGGMTNKKYQHLTGSSAATGQRDLADLVKKGCLIHTGSGRSVRYELAPANSGHQKTST